MPNHIGRMIDIHHQIIEEKGIMDDMILAYAIFHSLPNNNIEWNVLKTSLIKKGSSLTLSQAMMSLNGLYDCITQNKRKTEHLALVAKSQGASNHGNTAGKKKKFKKKPSTQNLIIYIAPVVKKVIGVQRVLKKERKMVQVEVVEADQQIWL